MFSVINSKKVDGCFSKMRHIVKKYSVLISVKFTRVPIQCGSAKGRLSERIQNDTELGPGPICIFHFK